VESYGNPPVSVYAPEHPTDEDLSVGAPPEGGRHGNFFDAAYAAIAARPEWMRRFDKIHAQGRALPKAERRWRELDSSMSSDALLMNVFCTPGVAKSGAVRRALGVDGDAGPVFGWKARVPLGNGRFDRTEVDMRWGGLLVEAKLTEGDFQSRAAGVVEGYRDFDAVFERELLPRVVLAVKRRREATEFPEDYSQEYEDLDGVEIRVPLPEEERGATREFSEEHPSGAEAQPSLVDSIHGLKPVPVTGISHSTGGDAGYAGYQLIRNVLAAYAEGCSFCVLHDERRPDLREEWYRVMAAVKPAQMRVRLKVLTWQEFAALLPEELQGFLDWKYGIVRAGRVASAVGGSGAD
jgi:hypothetical protein